MRKTLLIAAALCLSASAMAQTFEKPLSVSQGNNLYSAPQAGNVYWDLKQTRTTSQQLATMTEESILQ